MKASLFAALATAALLTATSAFAAPFNDHDGGPRYELRPGDRDFNYGYARDYRVSPRERDRWEASRRAADQFDRTQNLGFDRGQQVSREERHQGEEAHNHGYDQGHRVTPQERGSQESGYRR